MCLAAHLNGTINTEERDDNKYSTWKMMLMLKVILSNNTNMAMSM